MKPHAIEPLESRITPAVVFAVTSADQLISFDAYEPGVVDASVAIGGLQPGETIEGIDFRPLDGLLYALGSTSRLYTIDTVTGVASQVGSGPFAIPLSGTRFGFDFDPQFDQLRIISDTEQNFRVNPDTGEAVDGDPETAGVQPDSSLTASGTFSGAAYSDNVPNSDFTFLYVLDSTSDELYLQGSFDGSVGPDSGTITQFSDGLGVNVDAGSHIGFDIGRVFGFETALASLQVGGLSRLYNINLGFGVANLVGTIGTGAAGIKSVAISPDEVPAQVTLVNPRTATFTDIDGDLVTVSISKGALSQQVFSIRAEGPGSGAILQTLDLNLAQSISGANVSITAKRTSLGGDGSVNVGYIKAIGIDLGTVKVSGDLARIDAGDDVDKRKSITSLDVLSLGTFGASTQSVSVESDPFFRTSLLTGGVSKITVRGTVDKASILVAGNLDSKIGSLTILGDLIGGPDSEDGTIAALDSDIGSVKIAGSILGGSGNYSGSIFASRILGTANVLGSLIGGAGAFSGGIQGGTLGQLTVGGDMYGGSDEEGIFSGAVQFVQMKGKVTVKGSLIGGPADGSGSIATLRDTPTQTPFDGDIVSVTVGGSLFGGEGIQSGAIYAENSIKSATVNGSLNGSLGQYSGSIYAFQTLGKAIVRGDMWCADGLLSGSIAAENRNEGGAITTSVIVGGSIFATGDDVAGIVLQGSTGSVKIGGNVRGLGFSTVDLFFVGYPFSSPPPANAAAAVAIKSLTIGGDVTNARILSGFDGAGPARGDASIGAVTIGGSVRATNIIAAVDAGDDAVYGTADDRLFGPAGPGLVPTLGPVTIKGQLLGSPGGDDGFVITAAVINSLKIGSTIIPLNPNGPDLITGYGAGRDITIREVTAI